MKKTFCFMLLLFIHNCILVYMAMKKSLFLSFLYLDGTKIHQKYELPNFFLKNI